MWNSLIDILLKLTKIYDELFLLNEKKRSAVLDIDMHILDMIVDEEQKLTDIIMKVEKERQDILKKMAAKNALVNKLSNSKTLTMVCPTEYKEKFLTANEKLSNAVKRTADINETNRLLLRGALTAVNININALVQMKAEPNYKENGNQQFFPQNKNLDFKV
ncbi:flagellar export chaperone FlgN [Pectinatus haikarae]|uniref:flagellar export chaperone FlgN n=1 Tax=Pectinatus haikarae TaxID=349096 RepID=UPI0027D89386|nr:flagellar export chaperone FlgN [Pectinatus haikarae]